MKREPPIRQGDEGSVKEARVERLWWDLSDTIPTDIWTSIFSDLDLLDIWRLTNVNKNFHQLLKASSTLYSHLYSKEGQFVRMQDYLELKRERLLAEIPVFPADEPVHFISICKPFKGMEATVTGRVATRGLLFEQPVWDV